MAVPDRRITQEQLQQVVDVLTSAASMLNAARLIMRDKESRTLAANAELANIEFCTSVGGGSSPRTRAALIALMVAIEADNAESPRKQWPPAEGRGKVAPKQPTDAQLREVAVTYSTPGGFFGPVVSGDNIVAYARAVLATAGFAADGRVEGGAE